MFFDAAFVILVNLIKSISRKGKIPLASLACALGVGLLSTQVMVMPTPGPAAVAGTMGVNIGWFLLYSIIASLPAALIGGYAYSKLIGKNPKYANNFAEDFDDVDEDVEIVADKSLPSSGLGIFLILLPIVTILLGTTMTMFLAQDTMAYAFFSFIGDKNMALLVSVLVAFLALRNT